MPQVELWNDNTEDYSERFRNDMIIVPAKSFIPMERSKAIAFAGTLTGANDRGEMKIKMLRIHEDPQLRAARLNQPLVTDHKCQACGNEFLSDKELETHIEVHHSEQKVESNDKQRSGRGRKAS